MKTNLTKNDAIRAGLVVAVVLNVILTVGVAVAYHEGYQSGIERGVEIGSNIATDNTAEDAVVSEESSTPSSDTEAESNDGSTAESSDALPRAGVTFDQRKTDAGMEVLVQVVSMERADRVIVEAPENTCTNCTLGSVGEAAHIRRLAPGDKIVVIAEFDGRQTVIQTYSVADPYHHHSRPSS